MYFANPKNRDIIERLRVAGVRLEADEEDTSEHTDKLAGKSIVISGVFAHHSRDEYKELIESMAVRMWEVFRPRPALFWQVTIWGPVNWRKRRNWV